MHECRESTCWAWTLHYRTLIMLKYFPVVSGYWHSVRAIWFKLLAICVFTVRFRPAILWCYLRMALVQQDNLNTVPSTKQCFYILFREHSAYVLTLFSNISHWYTESKADSSSTREYFGSAWAAFHPWLTATAWQVRSLDAIVLTIATIHPTFL